MHSERTGKDSTIAFGIKKSQLCQALREVNFWILDCKNSVHITLCIINLRTVKHVQMESVNYVHITLNVDHVQGLKLGYSIRDRADIHV